MFLCYVSDLKGDQIETDSAHRSGVDDRDKKRPSEAVLLDLYWEIFQLRGNHYRKQYYLSPPKAHILQVAGHHTVHRHTATIWVREFTFSFNLSRNSILVLRR